MILHVIANLRAAAGGPPRSVAALVDNLSRSGRRVGLFTRRIAEPEVSVVATVERFYGTSAGGVWAAIGLDAGSRARREVTDAIIASGAKIVHSHGIWTPACHAVAAACAEVGVPHVISVRGMLEPWAVRSRGAKKMAAWNAYQRRDLANADAIHATSGLEMAAIRRMGLRQPIILIPNGIFDAQPVRRRQSPGLRQAFFLSRISPKKGLPLLLDAWNRVRPPNWRLVIAGNDDRGHASFLRSIIASLGIADSVSVVPGIPDADKWSWYARSDLFILPTHSENFGLVVAEAMLSGLPVITTHGAPWELLENTGTGWWVPITVESIASALSEAVQMDPHLLQSMGDKAQQVARFEFDWNSITARFCDAYDWVIAGGSLPDCIHLDAA
jgi:glycosyltransferase involved in cell wall biosynthesis